jgi:cell division protein FtsL
MQGQVKRQYEYGFPSGGYNTRPRTARQRKRNGLAAKDKKMLLMAVLAAGLIGIMIIISAAFSASINYRNNQLQREISQLEGEVESLEIDIQSSNNIAVIEKSASKDLGMKYADGNNCVTIKADKQTGKKFAAKLKADAFN